MRKGKALLLSIVTAIGAVSCIPGSQFTLMWAFAALTALFYGIWLYKYLRDRNIIAQARLEREAAQTIKITPPMTSKGSQGLFVPPPLQEDE